MISIWSNSNRGSSRLAQVMALRLLYNIHSAMRQIQGRFRDLFAKENQGARGLTHWRFSLPYIIT